MTTPPVPSHLAGHVVPVPTHVPDARRFELRSADGGDLFEVWFSGELWEAYNLIVGADLPSLVVAVAQDTGERVVLFDGARHSSSGPADVDGLAARVAGRRYCSPQGTDVFRIAVEVIDEPGETPSADGYTSLSICGIDEDDDRFWFVEEDLT